MQLRNPIRAARHLLAGGLFLMYAGTAAGDGLHAAAVSRDLRRVEAEIDGADVDAKDEVGRTALWHACSIGWANGAESLLSHRASPDTADRCGVTPVVVALRRGHRDVLRILLQSGAKPDQTFGSSFVPLHLAIEQGDLQAVDLLLAAGADPLAEPRTGDPATDLIRNTMLRMRLRGMLSDEIAAIGDDGKVAPILFQVSDAVDSARAIGRGASGSKVLDTQVRGPVEPSTFTFRWDGRTADGRAASPGRYAFELQAEGRALGRAVRRVIRVSDTSLFEAAAFGRAELVRAVLAYGAAVDERGSGERTPLMLGAAFANDETVKALLTAGTSVFAEDVHGGTALDYARTFAPNHPVVALLQAYQDDLTVE